MNAPDGAPETDGTGARQPGPDRPTGGAAPAEPAARTGSATRTEPAAAAEATARTEGARTESTARTGSAARAESTARSDSADGGEATDPAGASVAVDRQAPSGATLAPASRRFPRFTRGVARPEGGGRAASGDAPAPARQWPMLAVLGTAGIGLLITALDVFRVGTLIIGLALVGGAVIRWMVPSVGMLAVRSRFTDMITYGGLGVLIVLLALMAQPDPWLEIPFLDDALHFTVK
ncbi:DUF3017 domain-containing protein [Streptomyces physcomitrii]|uniref:DUF3017 domain-containing protein n=1 Tax=Streptomyces physcomitrii TaxID=2724184 RepID=A0ABX1GWS0_9ACTN|nr:DUF3017 domain-containing protein [Streptomyces physcomitrii]NKI40541.1 DUF3017 domain-containing protein [Streptomyces physcomitrii]